MKNQKSAIEIVNEVLVTMNKELATTIKNLKNARETNGHLRMVCFWPETFTCVSYENGKLEITNTPTLFGIHDAINVIANVTNGHNQHPKMKTETSFYELKVEWLSQQIENTQSLLN